MEKMKENIKWLI